MMHGGLTTLPMVPREGGVGKKDCMSRNALGGRAAELEPEDGAWVLRTRLTGVGHPKVQYETGESPLLGQRAVAVPCPFRTPPSPLC